MRKIYILLIFLGFFNISEAINLSDSLKILSMPDDTPKVNLIYQFAEELRDYNTEQGLEYAEKALELSFQLNYKKGEGLAYKAMGIIYYRMGIYDDAMDYCFKAIEIFKDLNEKYLLCKTYNNIGLVYFNRLEFQKAREYLQKALDIAGKLNNKTEQARVLHNLALIEFEDGNPKKSLENHYKSNVYANAEKNHILVAYNLCFIGKCYTKLAAYDSARINLEKSIAMFKELENPNLIAMAYNQYANYFVSIKNYAKTIEYAGVAYKLGEKVGNKYMRQESLDLIAKAYTGLKDFENALKFRTRFYELSDTMRNEDNIKSIARLETKFEYEQKIKELNLENEKEILRSKMLAKTAILVALMLLVIIIVLFYFYKHKARTNTVLLQKTEEILLLNQKLKNSNITKDKFFSIIAHDLKSPFQSIIGFSELLVEKIKLKEYDNIEQFGDIIQNSSQRAMNLLLNLLEWARSQTGKMEFKPESVDMVELINDTIDLINDSATQKSIKIEKHLQSDVFLVVDKAMIATVLRNIISNAVKFTDENGEILIKTFSNHDNFIISVSDNGIGIDKANAAKLFRIEESFSTVGTHDESGTGLGLILCKEFVEKHGGRIWVESEVRKGSKFSVELPVN